MTRGIFSCLGSEGKGMVGGKEGVERAKQPFQASGGLLSMVPQSWGKTVEPRAALEYQTALLQSHCQFSSWFVGAVKGV